MDELLQYLREKVYAVDRDRRITYANHALLESCGISLDEIIGKNCSTVPGCCPISDPDGHCPHEEVLESGQPLVRRFVNYTGDGFKRVFEMNASPLKDTGGKVNGVVATVRDVTESVRLEEILEGYAEGLTVLYEISTVFMTTSGAGKSLGQALSLMGSYYKADYTLVLLPGTEPGTLDAAGGTGWNEGTVENLSLELTRDFFEGYSMLEKCPAIVSDFGRDTRFKKHQFLVEHGVMSGISVPMVAHDRAMGVLCILYRQPQDIDTAELWYLNVAANTLGVYLQKERSLEKLQGSEAFITSVLEAIGEGVVVVGPDFSILSANKEYLRMADMVDEEVVGRHCYEVSHKFDSPCYEHGESCTVKRVFETGKSASSLHTHYRRDGSPVYVQTHAYPVKESSGKVTAAVETVVDVTDKVRLEKDLERRVKELEEFYDMAVGRELRMIELKEEVEFLKAQLEQYRKQA